MAEGQNAAESTKGFFKNLSNATEDIRRNMNSFADDLLSKDKTANSGPAPAGGHKTNHTSDATGSGILGSGDVHTGNANATGGSASGVHPDAQAAGAEIEKGINSISQSMHKK